MYCGILNFCGGKESDSTSVKMIGYYLVLLKDICINVLVSPGRWLKHFKTFLLLLTSVTDMTESRELWQICLIYLCNSNSGTSGSMLHSRSDGYTDLSYCRS